MTICPFCKKAVVNPNGGPCPSCGKVDNSRRASAAAMAAPAQAASGGGDEWDELEIQRGSSGQAPTGPSSYSGGGLGGLGDDDDDNGPGLSLELDSPPVHSAPPPQQPMMAPGRTGTSGQHPAYGSEPMPQPLPPRSMKPGSDPAMSQQQSSPNVSSPPSQPQIAPQQPQHPPGGSFAPQLAPPPGPPDAATMIARFPAPPQKVWQTPAYAMRVLYRQFELRQDIDSLRKRRSPDVPLYERALKTHDKTNFAIGLAITCAAFTIATFIFFLPVILRFVRDPE